jgi:hypothetical protein
LRVSKNRPSTAIVKSALMTAAARETPAPKVATAMGMRWRI